MKNLSPPHIMKSSTIRKVTNLMLAMIGLTAGAYGQIDDYYEPDPEYVSMWREWMSVLQREPSQVSGPRLYIKTEREILQTSANQAAFQNGRYSFILADGSVPDVDGDLDGFTDVLEDKQRLADRDDPSLFPPLNLLDSFDILLANGSPIGISELVLSINSQASAVKPLSGSNVRLIMAPPSRLVRPNPFRDFSGLFYYYWVVPGQPVGAYYEYPLSLYAAQKEFPNPSQCNELEETIVPGEHRVEFPTIANQPLGRGNLSVAHRLVPNGSLTIGTLKKPTWLIRSLKTIEKPNTPPVAQSWVNGRLKFDPYLPMQVQWDNLVSSGLAASSDFIEFWLEDDIGQISYSFRMYAYQSSLAIDLSNTMNYTYGTIRELSQARLLPFSENAHLVMKYSRYANGASSADISTVTVRTPVELYVSYASWRNQFFSLDNLSDSVAGPSADPDRDGRTNLQEYQAGTDPLTPTVVVSNPNASNITTTTATLGASVTVDPLSPSGAVTVLERGMIYSESSANPFPVIDGPSVMRVAASSPMTGDFTIGVTGLASSTQYSYRGYVITNLGVSYTSPVTTFTTLTQAPLSLPTIVSPTSSVMSATSAMLGANITSNGGSDIINYGVVYSITSVNDNPFRGGTGVLESNIAANALGVFSISVSSLSPSTTYSFRAYAINSVGTSHTSTIGTFTTPGGPTIISPTATNVTVSSATLGGNVTSDGGLAILQRGVVFSLTSASNNPFIGGPGVRAFVASTNGTGVFTVNVTGLEPGRSYSFKAYAINGAGTFYSTVSTFITSGVAPTLTGAAISNITATTATIGSTLTSEGSSAVIEMGFVYSPSSVNGNPLVGGTGVVKVTTANTTGVFTSNIAGLVANTAYTFKAFATNAIGTAYSAPYAFFTTLPPLTVTTPTVSDITSTTANLGGTVVSDSGTTALGRGVVYSLSPGPVLSGPGVITVPASGTMGPFTVNVSGLTGDTEYFFRAYAFNSSGPSYSDELSFRTLAAQLLGNATIEWQPVQQPAAASLEGPSFAAPSPTSTAPRFVYEKDPSELGKFIAYLIETTTNMSEWQPIDQTRWNVNDTEDTIEAVWTSSETPPSGLFFRVKGLTE